MTDFLGNEIRSEHDTDGQRKLLQVRGSEKPSPHRILAHVAFLRDLSSVAQEAARPPDVYRDPASSVVPEETRERHVKETVPNDFSSVVQVRDFRNESDLSMNLVNGNWPLPFSFLAVVKNFQTISFFFFYILPKAPVGY